MTTKELRELDAWIAENVMGWKWFRFRMKKTGTAKNAGKGYDRWQQLVQPNDTWHLQPKWGAIHQPQGEGNYLEVEGRNDVPHYTTDPAAAMEVLKKCQSETTVIIYASGAQPMSSICDGNGILETAETLELAICEFAKALFSK